MTTELQPQAVEINGLQIGYPQVGNYVLTDLNVGGKPETTAGDKPRPREDGVFFGRDLLSSGRSVVLEGAVSVSDPVLARTAWENLTQEWDAQDVRYTPGSVVPLRLRMHNGPTRVVYGRPRELDPKDDPGYALVNLGVLGFAAQFRCVDHLFYDDVEQFGTIGVVSDAVPGLRSPLRSPLTSGVTGEALARDGQVEVGGTQPAWPSFTIHGPALNPMVLIFGLGYLQLAMYIAYDDFVTIQTAPWNRGVLINGVTNAAGYLTQGSLRLSKARLYPGLRQVTLRTISYNNAAYLSTSWRDCFAAF
ncbi:MAG: hypothetical protein ACOYB2_19540 [Limnohabitans sp.]